MSEVTRQREPAPAPTIKRAAEQITGRLRQPERKDRALLTRHDQTALAAFLGAGLLMLCLLWLLQTVRHGSLVEWEELTPLEATYQVDPNTADWVELSQLPEIGESLAKRIVADRDELGPFQSVDDLDRVRGIGPKTLDKMRRYLKPIESADGGLKP